ncbi:MAG: T9SS type A sorting domain-containing protein, partial [Candidatus Latescibacterota bacterium]
FDVSTAGQLELRFSEPLFHRRGFTALDVQLRPQALSGPLVEVMEVRGDGRMVVFPVELSDETVYRLMVFGATGQSGLPLFDVVESTFSTGSAAPLVAALSGAVSVDVAEAFTGSALLFDLEGSLVAQTSVSLDGSFELSGVTAGTYHLFAEGELADGRIAGGAYDVNGDGVPDILSVEGGDPLTGLAIAATARGSVTPPVTGVQLSVDLDGQSGDQRLQSIGGAGPDQKVVLEVYARGLEDLAGVGVTVSYDSSQVYLRDFEPGNHVLKQADGTVLFVSAIKPDIPSVDLGGAIMGATSATAVTGAGLLGRFYFTTLEAFAGEAQFTVSHVSLKTLSGVTRLEPGLVATVSDLAEQVFPEGPVSIDFNRAAGNQDQRRGGSATPGSRYPMELWVSSAPEINGWGVTIEYDATQVTFVSGSFEASDYLPGIFALAEEGTGWVIPGGSVLASDVTASGDGMLGTLEFEVLSGFTDSTDLVISQVQLKHVDTGEEIIPVHYVATITASRASGLVGDFNGDGRVGLSDFFVFADAFGGTDPEFDLTGDGRVNLSDFFVFTDAFGTKALAKLLAVAEVYLGVPLRAQLAQNYPNPFNSDTVIEYQLPQPGEMQLEVYDLAGQRVTTLASGSRAAGSYSVAWDGSGDDSQPVASGVYLYRLHTKVGLETRKLILLR